MQKLLENKSPDQRFIQQVNREPRSRYVEGHYLAKCHSFVLRSCKIAAQKFAWKLFNLQRQEERTLSERGDRFVNRDRTALARVAASTVCCNRINRYRCGRLRKTTLRQHPPIHHLSTLLFPLTPIRHDPSFPRPGLMEGIIRSHARGRSEGDDGRRPGRGFRRGRSLVFLQLPVSPASWPSYSPFH